MYSDSVQGKPLLPLGIVMSEDPWITAAHELRQQRNEKEAAETQAANEARQKHENERREADRQYAELQSAIRASNPQRYTYSFVSSA